MKKKEYAEWFGFHVFFPLFMAFTVWRTVSFLVWLRGFNAGSYYNMLVMIPLAFAAVFGVDHFLVKRSLGDKYGLAKRRAKKAKEIARFGGVKFILFTEMMCGSDDYNGSAAFPFTIVYTTEWAVKSVEIGSIGETAFYLMLGHETMHKICVNAMWRKRFALLPPLYKKVIGQIEEVYCDIYGARLASAVMHYSWDQVMEAAEWKFRRNDDKGGFSHPSDTLRIELIKSGSFDYKAVRAVAEAAGMDFVAHPEQETFLMEYWKEVEDRIGSNPVLAKLATKARS